MIHQTMSGSAAQKEIDKQAEGKNIRWQKSADQLKKSGGALKHWRISPQANDALKSIMQTHAYASESEFICSIIVQYAKES